MRTRIRISGLRTRVQSAIAGTAVAPAVVFALVTAALAFTVVGLPRYDVDFRTRALHHTLAMAGPDDTSIVVSARKDAGAQDSPQQFESFTAGINSVLAQRLPMAPDNADWSTIVTDGQTTLDAPAKAVIGAQPNIALAYRTGLDKQARVIAGTLPGIPVGPPHGIQVIPIAVPQVVAARFGLRVGEVVHAIGDLGALTLKVVGIVAPSNAAAPYWTEDPSVSTPAFVPATGRVGAHWDAPVYISDVSMGIVFPVTSDAQPVPVSLRWVLPLQLGGFDADHIAPVVAHVSAVVAEGSVAQSDSPDAQNLQFLVDQGTVSSLLPDYLGRWVAAQDSLVAVLSLLLAGTAAIGLATLMVAGRLVVTRREAELALWRARGGSVRQLALRVGAGSAVVALPTAATGAVLGRLATSGSPPTTLAWWFAGVAAAFAVLAPTLTVVARHRSPNRSADQAREQSSSRYAWLRRWVAEGSLIVAAVAGLVVLRQQGSTALGSTAQGSAIDIFPAAAPALVAVPPAVLAPYGSIQATRLVRRGVGRRRGAAVFVGLAQAGRPRPGAATAIFALVLALGIVSFGPMLRDSVARGEVAASWAVVGADAVVDVSATGGHLTPDRQRAFAAASRATASLTADVTQSRFIEVLPTSSFTTGVVDPAAYAALLSGTTAPAPPPAFAARPPAGAPVPVVVSPGLANELGTDPTPLTVSSAAPITVRVVGVMTRSALVQARGEFVLVPAWAVQAASRSALGPPNLLALRGAPLDEAGLSAAVAKQERDARLTLRSAALAALPSASMRHGAYTVLALGAAAAAVFSILILLLSLSIDARARQLVQIRLRCLGLGGGGTRAAAFVETLPALLMAALGGIVAAALVGPVVAGRLDLSSFTGSPTPVGIRPAAAELLLPAAGLVLVASAALLVHTALTSRWALSRALRTGDW
jgi:putative ABC transport system permease protein